MHFRRSNRRLVVTFDNMKSRDAVGQQFPWGYQFLEKMGVSHLGLMMSLRNDWFRHADVWAFFDLLQQQCFFDRFDDVVFYGSSMGGYGALTYCRAVPGARVVAFMPQTHLDQTVVPFENRFRRAFERGRWNGRYVDGADGAQSAAQVYVLYDPYHAEDAAHVARLAPENLTRLHLPWAGHQAGRVLHLLGVLPTVVGQAFDGTLTEAGFRAQVRAAKRCKLHTRLCLTAAVERGHEALVVRTPRTVEAIASHLVLPIRRDER